MARTGRGDGVVESRQRTDMDHHIIPKLLDPDQSSTSVANRSRKRRLAVSAGHGVEIILLDRGRQGRSRSEKASRFGDAEAGKHGGFEEGRAVVGGLDDRRDVGGKRRWQSESHVDRSEQAVLHRFVGAADDRLERRDHVADHVFGRVVQHQREGEPSIDVAVLLPRDLADEQRVLRHRKNVLAHGLAVPACDPGEAVGDVLDFDVERRGVEQVEPASRQHPLPRPQCSAGATLRPT